LLDRFSRQQADNALSELVKQGKIRRVARGIYDYPAYSELLQKPLSPDIDQVARAYARKNNWRIEISGEAALNLLGLSTQVPGRYVYLSDGPNREYDILGQTLAFKKSNLKNIGFKYRESNLLVQAIKALGKAHIDKKAISMMRDYIEPAKRTKIVKDTQSATDWIHAVIQQVCRED
tara:strand:+ start:18749 stop:19279 length:531 start_codon:yes stop_codon:yes gene_type:complete